VIRMKNPLDNITFLFPENPDLNSFIQMPTEEPFSENALTFLNALSRILRNDVKTNKFPEIATFAFFCRRANLIQLKKIYYPGNNRRSGRGIVFHITPSNVPLNFAYSLLSGILSGNLNIVRVASKKSEQMEIIFQAIRELSSSEEFGSFSRRMLFVQYDKQHSATNYFSSICDVRIIWAGDSTLREIQKNLLPAHAFDVTFKDKYSFCVIHADSYIHEESPQIIAQRFYNDTFLFDQNACTSPHLIIWLGSDENILSSKKIFWMHLYDLVKIKYPWQPHAAVAKLTTFYNQVLHLDGIKKTAMPDNLIWRIELMTLSPAIVNHRGNCGYFAEYNAASLSEISGIISRKCQTLAYYGIPKEELIEFTTENNPNGMDRIVPVGKTSDFSLTWDGYNLIDTLSRVI
jgi:hypothetical protein